MNDALDNRVEDPCWQTPGTNFAAIIQRGNHILKAKMRIPLHEE